LLAEQAKRDLRGIYEYFAFTRLEPKLGKKIKQRIVEKLNSLNEMPHRYPVYQEEPWKTIGLRQVFAGSYCIFYLVTENRVHVARIMYGSMDLSAALSETASDGFQ
ncbi:MAG: type II toxin-antitoxin system RelE/ParE family toxin, partial [Defluviitaleaceae bacterium]|nr:type II toxin-antitoxin system RelE/ParE family toxin [Defluviitaleaceae bacterium]